MPDQLQEHSPLDYQSIDISSQELPSKRQRADDSESEKRYDDKADMASNVMCDYTDLRNESIQDGFQELQEVAEHFIRMYNGTLALL